MCPSNSSLRVAAERQRRAGPPLHQESKTPLRRHCVAAVLILTSPLLLAAMLAVKLTSPGPIFYRQVRSGRFGRVVRVTKLRTMCDDAEKAGPVWASKDDPRVTSVGRAPAPLPHRRDPAGDQRSHGPDVLRGTAPGAPRIIEKTGDGDPIYQERLMVQPGITAGLKSTTPTARRSRMRAANSSTTSIT